MSDRICIIIHRTHGKHAIMARADIPETIYEFSNCKAKMLTDLVDSLWAQTNLTKKELDGQKPSKKKGVE